MQTVMNEELAQWFAQNDYFYIMHRFDEEARIPFIKKMQDEGYSLLFLLSKRK